MHKNIGNETDFFWSALNSTEASFISGENTSELLIERYLFESPYLYWMVELNMVTVSNGVQSSGSTSMILILNQRPYGGNCSIDLTEGVTYVTFFNIICEGWIDSDGVVTKYEFYATTLDLKPILLAYEAEGNVNVTLPAGPNRDSNNVYVTVHVYDDSGAFTVYNLSTPISVNVDPDVANNTIADLLSPKSELLTSLSSFDTKTSVNQALIVLLMLNQDNQNNLKSNNSNLTRNQNERAQINEVFINFLSNLTVSNLNEAQMVCSTCTLLTNNANEITHNSASTASLLSAKLSDVLLSAAFENSFASIKSPLDNVIKSSFSCLNIVNLKTQSSNSSNNETSNNSSLGVYDQVRNVLSNGMKIADLHLSLGKTTTTTTDLVQLSYSRSKVDELDTTTTLGLTGASINITNDICSLFDDQSVKCSNRVVVQQAFTLSVAVNGRNTNLNLNKSTMVSLSFFENTNSLSVSNQTSKPIVLNIPRSGIASKKISFSLINTSNLTLNALNQIYTFGMNLSATASSIHFNLNPSSSELSYLMVLKYGKLPVVNTQTQIYDRFKIVCPQTDLITDSNGDTFYLLFSNKVSSSFAGIGVRQLTLKEDKLNCLNRTNATSIPVLGSDSEFINITTPFSIRSYTSGCYFLNKTSGYWSTQGLEVQEATNLTTTVCSATHLTDFAGGFIVLPDSIDFDYVFAHASFAENMTIYLTVIIIFCLYIILFVICLYLDRRDASKTRIYLLNDNDPDDLYFYEIIVFNGRRLNSGTESNV
jgi:hypothetical protein